MSVSLSPLPPPVDVETRAVLKKLARAHQALAELKGVAATIPNQTILIDTLSLQEAKDSSAIENIITTHDDLFRSDSAAEQFVSLAAKEVHRYATALRAGFDTVRATGLLTVSDILDIQALVEGNRAGLRKLPGTALKNERTGETVYTPPQHPDEITALMANLVAFINDGAMCDWDPLTKMAVVHFQFESIHPFYDGNGRTGRILNILYLVHQELLGSPVLYLSRYINQTRDDYYRLLQAVRTDGAWEEWVLSMLEGVEQTARQTTELVLEIRSLMQRYKTRMRDEASRIYSQDLLNNLFRHPYTKVEFLLAELQVHRNTATKYLDKLAELGLVKKLRLGRENFYLNEALFALLLNVGVSEPGRHA